MEMEQTNLRSDARRNYELLLSTARKMLELPNPDFSFNELAKRAGVGVGTLYRHFPSKQKLLEVVYADELAKLRDNVFTGLPPDQALEKWFQEVLDFTAKSPGLRLLISDILSDATSTSLSLGPQTLLAAQKAGLIRTDVNIRELFGLLRGIVESTSHTNQQHTMLAVIMAGLRR